jgi:hypothetical protein
MGASTTFFAPVHRALARMAIGGTGFSLNAAPSLDFLGSGLQDHRLPVNSKGSSANQPGIIGFYGAVFPTTNIVPSTAAVANIAPAANAVAGVALPLVGASGAGITVITVAAPNTFQPTGLVLTAGVAIDGLSAVIPFGGANGGFNTSFYNRSLYTGRCLSVTGVNGGTGGTVTIKGYDVYGYPMTQTVTVGAGINTVNTLKAFKVVTSVTPNFTDAHTYSVGTADIFGLPLYSNLPGDLYIAYNSTLVTALATGFVAGDVTSPATSLTGDVRGTYAVQSATDGVKRLNIRQAVVLTAVAANPTVGLFGQPQF